MAGDARSSLIFVSSNKAKLAEYREILSGTAVRMLNLQLQDLQHHNMEQLARTKINQVIESQLLEPFFVEHTGLVIRAWGELPGGLTGQFVEHFGCTGICAMLSAYGAEDRVATATTVIGYYDGKSTRIFPGQVSGRIASSPRGTHGFGWDHIFIPARSEKTYGEMTSAEKNELSMRRIAATAFADYLALNPIEAPTPDADSSPTRPLGATRAMPAKRHVFLSYSRDDSNEVASLCQDLRSAGETVWWDGDIGPGQDWKFAIREALRASYGLVLCLSAAAVSRVRSGIYPELSEAIDIYREYAPGSVFIIPVRLSECDIPQIELDGTRTLNRLQYVDLFPPDRRQVNFQRLVRALRLAPEHPLRGRVGG